jgi:hypothetical protein
MSELSILELETEHAELLPERETLSVHQGGAFNFNLISVHQNAAAASGAVFGGAFNSYTAVASNVAVIGS